MGSGPPVPPDYIPSSKSEPRKNLARKKIAILVIAIALIVIVGVYGFSRLFSDMAKQTIQREIYVSVHVYSDTFWSGYIERDDARGDEKIPIQIASSNQTLGYVLYTIGESKPWFALSFLKATDWGYLEVIVYNSDLIDPETGKALVLGTDKTTEPYGSVALSIMIDPVTGQAV